jgi:uncharacterized protein (UPF0548 family)
VSRSGETIPRRIVSPWSLSKPGERTIRKFLEEQARLDYSYGAVGASQDGHPAGYDLDHNRVRLGEGSEAFEAACAALRAWRMFPRPWTETYPPDLPLATGAVVAVLFHLFGIWWLNACRIVYTVDEPAPVRRFGFAYGTLPGHVESGEERFTVEQEGDGGVWYDIRAFSRPRHPLARLGYPLARRLQRRFVRDSQAAMRRAVAEG